MHHYIHHIPGRLRIKNPIFKNNTSILKEAKDCLTEVPGVLDINFNQLTGSLVIQYDTKAIHPDKMQQVIKDCGYVDERKAVDLNYNMKNSINKAGRHLGKACMGIFLQEAFKDSSLGLLFAFI